jgi:hypothetical protein
MRDVANIFEGSVDNICGGQTAVDISDVDNISPVSQTASGDPQVYSSGLVSTAGVRGVPFKSVSGGPAAISGVSALLARLSTLMLSTLGGGSVVNISGGVAA